jgi:hypothetical protein
MSSPEKAWVETPLRKLAEASLEKPGMYLIALRAHLARGKTMIGKMLTDVADAFPKGSKVRSSEDA